MGINRKETIKQLENILWEIKEKEELAYELHHKLGWIKQKKRERQIQQRKYDTCTCRHFRHRHGKSLNINYTDGSCRENCSCKHFLIGEVNK